MPQAMHAARFANRLAGWPGVATLVANVQRAQGARCTQRALPLEAVKDGRAVASDRRGARLYTSKQVAYA